MSSHLGKTREAFLVAMRFDIGRARQTQVEAVSQIKAVLSAGQPENGLKAALDEALKHAQEAADILDRTEKEHFAGVREAVPEVSA